MQRPDLYEAFDKMSPDRCYRQQNWRQTLQQFLLNYPELVNMQELEHLQIFQHHKTPLLIL